MLCVTDPFVAYCLDEATFSFGTGITSELEKIKGKNERSVDMKRNLRLMNLLGIKKFRDPAKRGS